MPEYIDPPIESDPDDLAADAFDYLVSNLPGWVPYDGHLESWLVEALARVVSEAARVASAVPTSIFRYFGESILGVDPVDAEPATASSTWTMVDDAGYTVPADTVVAYRMAGDHLIGFRVVESVVVPPGDTATAADAVTLRAVEAGVNGNLPEAGPVELVDGLAYVDSITGTSPSGGVDGESDSEYLNRLATELELLAPRPILPRDFAVMARRTAGVHRALAIDNYDPDTDTHDNERMVTVAVVDEDGAALDVAVRDDVAADLDARREVNFVVHVIDPTYTTVNVTFTVVVDDGWDTTDVETRTVEVVTAYLDPANWGGGEESPPAWRLSSDTVRYLEVASVIDAVEGVNYVETLTVNGGTVDVDLAGVAPLTQVGVIDGTATDG